jgi:hypothetical protein
LYRARIFLVGDRMYQVVALGPDEFAKSKAVDDYLNSFEIDELRADRHTRPVSKSITQQPRTCVN